jgi:hypothetical protein
MQSKYYALIIYFLTVYLCTINAQQPVSQIPVSECGTHSYSPWLNWYHDHKNEFASRDMDTNWLFVPTTIHITGPDNSVNFYSKEDVFRIICDMNKQYEPTHIHFYLVPNEPFVYHANSSWWQHDWAGGQEMIETTLIPDRLNCYIVDDPVGNCGYSHWLGAIVLNIECSGVGNTTWAHEAGHHFSLPHTFYGWENQTWDYSAPAPLEWDGYEVEKIDGSNCLFSGDGFCDTKPDYLNARWTCNDQSFSNQIQHDPNGVPFVSDGTLFMSYSSVTCRNRFSDEQIEAMRANLYTDHSNYLQASESGAPIADNAEVTYISPIDSAIQQYDNIVLNWLPVDNATFYQVEVGLSPSFSVTFFKNFVYGTSVNITNNIPNNRTLYWRVRPYSEWDLCKIPGTLPKQVFKTRNNSAITELERSTDINIAPNPTRNGNPVMMTITHAEPLNVQLTMNDASGQIMYKNDIKLQAGENEVEIPTQQLAAGFYLITLQTVYGILTKSVIITR